LGENFKAKSGVSVEGFGTKNQGKGAFKNFHSLRFIRSKGRKGTSWWKGSKKIILGESLQNRGKKLMG